MAPLRARAALGALALILAAAAAAAVDPGDITTCSNTNGTSVPKINSVKTCSSVSIISDSASGFSVAFSSGKSSVLVSAAGACGDAVADGVGSICRGLDPGAAIVGAAKICANALAAVYSRTASGAVSGPSVKALFDPKVMAGLAPSKVGYYQACTSSCNNARSAAESLAQGAACGAVGATNGCAAVKAEVSSALFARAFVAVTTDGWSKSCARGSGAALTGATTMAASAAASFASAIAKVAIKACASCPTCRCAPLPQLPGVNFAGKWAEKFAAFAGGELGLARALAGASSAMCGNGTKLTSNAAADGAMAAVANMIGGAVGSVKANGFRIGSATACSGANLVTQMEAMKEASSKVLADASTTVFGGWCPRAAAKLQNFSILTKDVMSKAANKTAEACGGQPKGLAALLPGASLGLPVSQQEIVANVLTQNAPLRQKFVDALKEAKKCGCPPSLCLFCSAADSSK